MVFNVVPSNVWIESDQELKRLCHHWLEQLTSLAMDTEFQRTRSYYPIPGLIQAFDGQQAYLIDPLKITDFKPLGAVLQAQHITKVLHSFSEDLEVLFQLTKTVPVNVFDTQLAAAFCGHGLNLGYQSLVNRLLDNHLEKEQTRSDWLQRPLTREQVVYAVQDVLNLLEIHDQLTAQLHQKARYGWFEDECRLRIHASLAPIDIYDAYKDVKLAWQLKSRELSVLRALAAWRESTAMSENKPRNAILNDRQLIQLAYRKPKHMAALLKVPGIRASEARKWGKQWFILIQNTLQNSDNWLERLPKPLSPHAGQWLKLVRDKIRQMAYELDLPPELLARKKQLECLVRSGYPSGPFAYDTYIIGWRGPLLIPSIEALLERLPQLMPPPTTPRHRQATKFKSTGP